MGLKVITYESMGKGDFKYVFVGGVMYRATSENEQHSEILPVVAYLLMKM